MPSLVVAEIGLLNPSLLWGLAAVAAPVWLHLRRKGRRAAVDWGAVMFLDGGSGASSRRSSRIEDWLLLAVRAAVLALAAVAAARPYWSSAPTAAAAENAGGSPPRVAARGGTFVLVVDVSAGMDVRRGGIDPRALALRWARRFVSALGADDSIALIEAGARSRPRIEPPTRDRAAALQALDDLETAGGGPGDLSAALLDAFRILTEAPEGSSSVVLLTDGARAPWRFGETLRWDLVRDSFRRLEADPPAIQAVLFGGSAGGPDPDDPIAIGLVKSDRTPALAGRPIVVSTVLTNTGTLPASAIGRLWVDGRPAGPAVQAGTIAPGAVAPLSFTAAIVGPGAHLLRIALDGGAEAEGLVEVFERVPVLIVDGRPSAEPFGGQADFLRLALDPPAVEAARGGGGGPVFRARVVPPDRLQGGLLKPAPDAPRVLILADVSELAAEAAGAVERYVSAGGGLLIATGDAARAEFFSGLDWFPGRLDDSVATDPTRLDSDRFSGPTMERFATLGAEEAPLARVEVFRRRRIAPGRGWTVSARSAAGDPWCVERSYGKGRILVVASALDARASTLPINPDFVPLVHEWMFSLARRTPVKRLQPGEPWVVALDPPQKEGATIPVRAPGGATRPVPVAQGEVRIDGTDAPGVYRLDLDEPIYAIVEPDARAVDPARLSVEDRARLTAEPPIVFADASADGAGDSGLIDRIRSEAVRGGFAGAAAARVEFWRILILAALAGLCLESWLTRRMSGL